MQHKNVSVILYSVSFKNVSVLPPLLRRKGARAPIGVPFPNNTERNGIVDPITLDTTGKIYKPNVTSLI